MSSKFSVKELVEIVTSLPSLEAIVVCDIISANVSVATIKIIGIMTDTRYDLFDAIANWNLDYPAHEDDAILLLLEELLEDVRCQQQPGVTKKNHQ